MKTAQECPNHIPQMILATILKQGPEIPDTARNKPSDNVPKEKWENREIGGKWGKTGGTGGKWGEIGKIGEKGGWKSRKTGGNGENVENR